MQQVDLIGASWIEYPYNEIAGAEMKKRGHVEGCFYKKQFHVRGNAHLTVSISAQSRYRIWVNGMPVLSGPCKGDQWRHYYETVDISQYLLQGENIITARVLSFPHHADYQGIAGPFAVMSAGGNPCFILKGSCMDDGGNLLQDLTTGRTEWFACIDETTEWLSNEEMVYMGSKEVVYGARKPSKLHDPDPDLERESTGWVQVKVKWTVEGNIYGELFPYNLCERPIPLLYEREREFEKIVQIMVNGEERELATTVLENGSRVLCVKQNSQVVVDFDAGELVTGYICLKMAGGAGARIRLTYAEAYSRVPEGKDINSLVKGVRDDCVNGNIIGHYDDYHPSGKDEIYEPFWFRTFRFLRMEIETGQEEISIDFPIYRETGYPMDVSSIVQSSEEWIQDVWDMSIRTLRRCMHETYEDCPYYEQLQYILDTRLEILYTYMVSGDTRLALRAIEDFNASRMPDGMLQSRYPCQRTQIIPAFSLFWVMMLEDYYWQTGSIRIVRNYQSTVDGILEWYEQKRGKYGLVENLGYWEFFDWVDEWGAFAGAPRAVSHGASTNHNLLYAYTLKVAANLCTVVDRPDVAREYHKRAELTLKAVRELCYCEQEGLFMEGPGFREYSQHSQVLAVLSGLAEGEEAAQILNKAISGKTSRSEKILKCSFPFHFFLFRALEKAGIYDVTRQLWDTWRGLRDLKLTTIPETPEKPRSDCHAWGSLPLYEFTRNFLGVSPGSPGWEHIHIEPRAIWMNDMSGRVITPKGIVSITWVRKGNKLHMDATTPKGVKTIYVLPGGVRYETPGGEFRAVCDLDYIQPEYGKEGEMTA